MKILSILNQKGGVWKTTTAVTVAHGMTVGDRRVLLVDLDAQGNVADCLGLEKKPSLHALLTGGDPIDAVSPSGRPRLGVVMGDRMTAETKRLLSSDPFGVFKLREALEGLADGYDVCVLDSAPGADILQMGALVAATHFLIPVALDDLAVVGAVDAINMSHSLEKRGAFQGAFLGVLPTQWERTTKESQYQLAAMTDRFGERAWPPIPVDTRAREAARNGKTLFEYDQTCRALRGVKTDSGTVGGYIRVIRRLLRELDL
jgi:chromosome partitioning protein